MAKRMDKIVSDAIEKLDEKAKTGEDYILFIKLFSR
jgi:hypothetical protein